MNREHRSEKPRRVTCDGMAVGAVWIPPFELGAGEVICLHMPCSPDSPGSERIAEALTGQRPEPGLHLFGRVVSASPATTVGLGRVANRLATRSGLSRFFRPGRAVDWLRRQARLSIAEARGRLTRLDVPPDAPLGQLAGTPRALLGLEAAWAGGADVVVFSTIGLDPLGYERVYRAVAAMLDCGAAVYLNYEFWQNGRLCRQHFPGATCVELTLRQANGLPASPAGKPG